MKATTMEIAESRQAEIQDLLNKMNALQLNNQREPTFEYQFELPFNAGAQIKEMRHQARLSQAELADLLQLSRARISTLEKQDNMSIRNFIEVADKMGFTVSITKKSPVT